MSRGQGSTVIFHRIHVAVYKSGPRGLVDLKYVSSMAARSGILAAGRGRLVGVLFMVIERFEREDLAALGERFRKHGRMLPEGVVYQASWVNPAGTQCFQVMEAPDATALQAWTERWDDLVHFEIVPVLASAEFWARQK